jgi:hypothetical protein
MNYALGIGVANYTHCKYFKSQENYDEQYDRAGSTLEICIETIQGQCHNQGVHGGDSLR